MSLLKSKTSSSNLDIMFDEPIKIDLSVTPTWKRNVVTEQSKTLYGTEGANYALIEGVDLDGVVAKYRISETVWDKCVESNSTTTYLADDGRGYQLVLPTTGSPRILAKLAAMRNAKLGVQTITPTTITPQGDSDAPF